MNEKFYEDFYIDKIKNENINKNDDIDDEYYLKKIRGEEMDEEFKMIDKKENIKNIIKKARKLIEKANMNNDNKLIEIKDFFENIKFDIMDEKFFLDLAKIYVYLSDINIEVMYEKIKKLKENILEVFNNNTNFFMYNDDNNVFYKNEVFDEEAIIDILNEYKKNVKSGKKVDWNKFLKYGISVFIIGSVVFGIILISELTYKKEAKINNLKKNASI